MQHYFDYAAATPLDDDALHAMQPYFTNNFFNPSALYLSAQSVKKDIQSARATIAKELGAKPSEIIFTAGGTEANNLAVLGVASKYKDAQVITSAIEHDSVLLPVKSLAHSIIPVDARGFIDLQAIKKEINDKTVLVSIMLANNEIGTIQDIKTIAQLIRDIRNNRIKSGNTRPIYLHTDACQAVNYIDIHISRLGVDLMTINAGKIYGPKQMGALFVSSNVAIDPIIVGGGQERGLRSGTENVANIIGFAQALQKTRSMAKSELERITKLQNYIISELANDQNIKLNGPSAKRRLANNIHITIDGIDNERLLMELDERGLMIATGSACSASSDTPSHVLKAIGLSDNQSRSSIRITLGRQTNIAQCEYLVHSIKEVVAKA